MGLACLKTVLYPFLLEWLILSPLDGVGLALATNSFRKMDSLPLPR